MNESCIASGLAIAVSKDNRKCHCCCDQLLTTVAATSLSNRPTLGHAHTQLTTQRGENTEAGQVGRWRDSATHSSTLQCPETPPPPGGPLATHTHTHTLPLTRGRRSTWRPRPIWQRQEQAQGWRPAQSAQGSSQGENSQGERGSEAARGEADGHVAEDRWAPACREALFPRGRGCTVADAKAALMYPAARCPAAHTLRARHRRRCCPAMTRLPGHMCLRLNLQLAEELDRRRRVRYAPAHPTALD